MNDFRGKPGALCACGKPAAIKKVHLRYNTVTLQCARRTCPATWRRIKAWRANLIGAHKNA